MFGASHLKELPFEALVGLLEEHEEDSPCRATEDHPQVLFGALSFKEMKKDVDGRSVPKVVAQYSERPHEGPTVGMQLGGGHVDLRQQCPLEVSEWEAEFDPFKNGEVKEEDRLSFVGPVINAHGFALRTRTNRDVRITLPPKHSSLAVGLPLPVLPHVLARVECGGFSEEFSGSPRVQGLVVYVGRRFGGGFCSSHLEES